MRVKMEVLSWIAGFDILLHKKTTWIVIAFIASVLLTGLFPIGYETTEYYNDSYRKTSVIIPSSDLKSMDDVEYELLGRCSTYTNSFDDYSEQEGIYSIYYDTDEYTASEARAYYRKHKNNPEAFIH